MAKKAAFTMERFDKFPQFETQRLILRKMTLSDLDFYFHHFNDQKIVEGTCFPGPKTLDAAEKELERYCINPFKENKGIRWGIVLKDAGELIGTLGFYDWDKDVHKVEIGYDLKPSHWGLGIMTEALQAVICFCFEAMGLNRIQAIIPVENHRSMNLVRRLGFTKEGVLRQNSLFNGVYRDDACFSLLIEEWKEIVS
ncbi:MAG: GNAT family N-acetyltransferase [Candidatus Bathyarchaeota archaeon]|nr:GNAT family N-acetyltransferase [Candidatus Bathyarchaeota archaeon]